MNQRFPPNQAIMHLKKELESFVAAEFRSLIESKHLYQTVQISPDHILKDFEPQVESQLERVRIEFLNFVHREWLAKDPYIAIGHSGSLTKLVFSMPDVKLLGFECGRVEAFNSMSTDDFLRRFGPEEGYAKNHETQQVFVASFLCQSCKSVPEVFVLRRAGRRLSICGRAPMERVDVPRVIPRILTKHYSSAVVAHNSGQSLAGNFLLRTLIEQWARNCVSNAMKLKADEILDAYMASLPEDFRSRFRSLRDLYGQLSSDLHTAVGDPQLFEQSLSIIEEHFDARRLYKL